MLHQQPTYHLLAPQMRSCGVNLITGDGVYGPQRLFGLTLLVPLISCEIRGLALIDDEREEIPAALPIGYYVLTQPILPDPDPAHIFAYVFAQNGVFLRARSTALDVLMPIAPGSLPGLVPASPYARCRYPKVPMAVVDEMLIAAQGAHNEAGAPVECLFYLIWEGTWILHIPEQIQTMSSVRALEETQAYREAVFEGHSHHEMAAYSSSTDNLDEVINGGFRAYFVLGRIHSHPEIRMRICVHGYRCEVPASWFFDLPESVLDRGATPDV